MSSPYGRPPAYPSTPTHHPGPHTTHWPAPARVLPVPGSRYALGLMPVPTTVSGPAVGALVAGAGALLSGGLAGVLGVAGAAAGWGAMVAGAFGILAGLLGAGGVGLGSFAVRQVRRQPRGVRGRQLAVAGIVGGALGLVLATCGVGLAVLIQSA